MSGERKGTVSAAAGWILRIWVQRLFRAGADETIADPPKNSGFPSAGRPLNTSRNEPLPTAVSMLPPSLC
jgi:hypothetical protein